MVRDMGYGVWEMGYPIYGTFCLERWGAAVSGEMFGGFCFGEVGKSVFRIVVWSRLDEVNFQGGYPVT